MDGFERRREQKKWSILEAALLLFMEYGVKKISISEIAKKANVSQVTIYNYFESKHNLVHEVLVHFVNKETDKFQRILDSEMPFPDKIRELIFNKKEAANTINEEFYQELMTIYVGNPGYIEKLYVEKAVPAIMELFNQGKEQGYVDPNISMEAILFYLQALNSHLQKEEVYRKVLPITEDIMQIMFYGMVGRKDT